MFTANVINMRSCRLTLIVYDHLKGRIDGSTTFIEEILTNTTATTFTGNSDERGNVYVYMKVRNPFCISNPF
ncbi:hypothetical protein ACH3XW_19280 [Acanthocheilonema viteae]